MKRANRTEKKANAVYRAVLSVGNISEADAVEIANYLLERNDNNLAKAIHDAKHPYRIDGHPTW